MQEIEIVDVRKITKAIQDKYNYDFSDYAMSSFKRRIKRVMQIYKFLTVDALIKRLEEDEDFFRTLLAEITVNVTEMFRDPPFWQELRDDIIPNILLNKDTIDVWHAGCSSGEEVFSLAILLKEMNLLDKTSITATDIDHVIIEKAKKGRILLKNMESNTRNYEQFLGINKLSDYYEEDGTYAQMDISLVKNVHYREHNLVKSEAFGKFDIVLCRNVMIYFNQTLQNHVLRLFHESLHKFGYIAVGSKESLIWCDIANKFTIVSNEEKIYKKIRD